jgi:hypothetical protein
MRDPECETSYKAAYQILKKNLDGGEKKNQTLTKETK